LLRKVDQTKISYISNLIERLEPQQAQGTCVRWLKNTSDKHSPRIRQTATVAALLLLGIDNLDYEHPLRIYSLSLLLQSVGVALLLVDTVLRLAAFEEHIYTV
jgi:hypothetical protein